MPCCDVTAGHYYRQLMTTAHASCHWPAAARFTEHGQLGIVTCYRPASSPTGHAPCSVNKNISMLFPFPVKDGKLSLKKSKFCDMAR